MIMFAKIENNKVTKLSSGPGDDGTWVEIENFQMGKEYKYEDGSVVIDEDAQPYTPTQEEIDASILEFNMENIRMERNRLLLETDHWAYQDTPDMTDEQIAYRQALRDITDTYTSLEDVVWPTKPV